MKGCFIFGIWLATSAFAFAAGPHAGTVELSNGAIHFAMQLHGGTLQSQRRSWHYCQCG